MDKFNSVEVFAVLTTTGVCSSAVRFRTSSFGSGKGRWMNHLGKKKPLASNFTSVLLSVLVRLDYVRGVDQSGSGDFIFNINAFCFG